MSGQVWKFGPLTEFDEDGKGEPQWIDMPHGATILRAGEQASQIFVWAEVNTTAPKVSRGFLICGTGWDIRPGMTYCGTVQKNGYVWHVYEVRHWTNEPMPPTPVLDEGPEPQ